MDPGALRQRCLGGVGCEGSRLEELDWEDNVLKLLPQNVSV